jgi:hypothetical protein
MIQAVRTVVHEGQEPEAAWEVYRKLADEIGARAGSGG